MTDAKELINTKNNETTETHEVPRGSRGEVGEASISDTIKRMWHEAVHTLSDAGNRHNPRKKSWHRKVGALSLKKFARKLALTGDATAKEWLARKGGSLNQERSDANRIRANAERAASKNARSAKK